MKKTLILSATEILLIRIGNDGGGIIQEKVAVEHVSMLDTMTAAYFVWEDTHVAIDMTVQAVAIIKKAYSRDYLFFRSKAWRCKVGGLFAILNYRQNGKFEQRRIAAALGISDVTIRANCQKWLKSFPSMFSDVAEILSQ
jgi:hypothetical protein